MLLTIRVFEKNVEGAYGRAALAIETHASFLKIFYLPSCISGKSTINAWNPKALPSFLLISISPKISISQGVPMTFFPSWRIYS